jgi:xanthine dehydrogenase accessory factor
MIGSEKRVRIVYQVLQQEGYPLQALRQVYAPIGLDIGALTPEEIAVSICAELIKVRRDGTDQSLSEKLQLRSSDVGALPYV